MSVDRTLTTVLELYQDVHDDARTEQIYATTTTLLTHLSNPLNLSLLTSQLLNAPAIWRRPDPLRACYRIISVFNTAAIHVRRHEVDYPRHRGPRPGGGLSSETWARAVIKGADDKSSRWKHLLVFAGILIGMEGGGRVSLPRGLRDSLEQAIVTAANLALETNAQDGPTGATAVVLALNYVFPLISNSAQAAINCDILLPFASQALVGEAGLNGGLFLRAINADVVRSGQSFDWPAASPSFHQLGQLQQQPLVSGLGPLSKLVSYAIEHARDSRLVLRVQDDLVAFTKSLLEQWQSNKLCEFELSEQASALTPETRETTWPALWQLLKKSMFAVVAILHQIVARSLLDRHLRNGAAAPSIATKSLHVLRNVYFVSSQEGNNAFQVYTFTYLAAIDILTQYPDACSALLQEIKPPNSGAIPAHPLLRTLDLFYLNLAEHLPLSLPPEGCDALIVQPATAYLAHSAPLSPRMLELFESAHSAVLSVLSCPNNAPLTIKLAPFYTDTLFTSFPLHISPHQFRLAFKTMMQILSPPFPISATHPELAETFLEMVRFRISTANPAPLPPRPGAQGRLGPIASPASEQSTLVMTLIDSLPFLHLSIFEVWMTLAAEALNEIPEPLMREAAKRRFWEILVNGEMDVERAAIGVSWWGTRGGRELVLYGRSDDAAGVAGQPMMSGAILDEATGSRL